MLASAIKVEDADSNLLSTAVELVGQVTRYEKLIKGVSAGVKKKGAQKRARPAAQSARSGGKAAGSAASCQKAAAACSLVSMTHMVGLLEGIDEAVATSLGTRVNRQELTGAGAQLHWFIVENTQHCLTRLVSPIFFEWSHSLCRS